MAGPCLTIVSPASFTDDGRAALVAVINGMSDEDSKLDASGRFRVGGRPFAVEFGSEVEGAPFDSELPIDGSIGVVPTGQFTLVAFCNRQSDHVLLAALATRLASLARGVIWIDASVAFDANSVMGALGGRTSKPGLGEFCTPAFVQHWLDDDDFRLPK